MHRNQKKTIGGLAAILLLAALISLFLLWRHFKLSEQHSVNQSEMSESVDGQGNDERTSSIESVPLKEPLAGLTPKEHAQGFASTDDELILRSVGDLLIHDRVTYMADIESGLYQSAVESLTDEGIDLGPFIAESEDSEETDFTQYDFAPMLAKIAPFTEYADVTIANLEVITAYPALPISGYPQFNAPSSLLTNLKTIGIDIVSNGTNHTLDWYSEGALLSIGYIRESGLMYVGSYESFEDQQTPRIIDQNGIKLGFLTYSYGTNGMPINEGEEYIISLVDVEQMAADVTALKEQVDAVVVTLQLGQEYETLPDDNQRYVFQALSDAGAKLILGGHPHVLQPVNWYNEKQTFAIYSQASFLSGQTDIDNKQGGITEVTFKRQEDGEVAVTDPKFMPIFISGVEAEEMYEVVPYADFAKYEIPEGQEWWNRIKERMTTYTDDFQYVTHLETERTEEEQNKHR